MDNFKIIYRILRYLEKSMDCEELDLEQISASKFGISEPRWVSLMGIIVSEGFVDGISVKRSVGGETLLSYSNPRITLKGLEYLQENSLMRKAAQLAQGVSEIIP